MPLTYRERLRIEGFTLAGSGALGSILLLTLTAQAKRWPLSTIGQLLLVVALLAYLGPRATRKALREARGMSRDELGSGEPTPLWQLPAIVIALTLLVAEPLGAGWDAGLRVTGGCTIVGLFQALVLERQVARAEQVDGRSYHRVPGSRIGRGTRLGHSE